MKLGSLFDGSGGFPLAGTLAGITPVWASEIEPYPIAVTRSRFPGMRHLGSVTEIHGDEVEPVDVITFGSPCQDLSVAGRRAGIHDGERSSLFFEAIRIIREMREKTNGRYPTFAVWENVPGAFSSNDGDDFRCVLEAFCETAGGGDSVPRPAGGAWQPSGEIVGDGFSVAWRQLDAQYWGVPQRRKRIYLVADFGGQRAGKILFERKGLRGRFTTRGETREGSAEDAEGRTGGSNCAGSGGCLTPWDGQAQRIYNANGTYPTLTIHNNSERDGKAVCYVMAHDSKKTVSDSGGAFTLAASDWKDQQYLCYTMDNYLNTSEASQGGAATLKASRVNDVCYTLNDDSKNGLDVSGGAFTLRRHNGSVQSVVYALDAVASNSMKSANPNSGFHETQIARTIQATGVDPTKNQGGI